MKFILYNKKIKYYTKEIIRWGSRIVFGVLLISAAIFIKFRPAYSVIFKGKNIGTVLSKYAINEAIEKYSNNVSEDIAFITIQEMPEFEFKLIDINLETNEEDVLLAIENSAVITYRRYAITLDGAQKAIVSTLAEAKEVVDKIKEELGQDLELNLAVTEIYDNNKITVETVNEALAKVNEDATVKDKIKELKSSVNGIVLHKPINTSVSISSRFGTRGSGYHTGLDLAVDLGTKIFPVASGKVTFAGWQGGYGNLIIISHGNGVETYYAHCSAIYVKSGDSVTTNDVIGAVGSTGNSTGPHLHLEVRVNGQIMNPQNYLYN